MGDFCSSVHRDRHTQFVLVQQRRGSSEAGFVPPTHLMLSTLLVCFSNRNQLLQKIGFVEQKVQDSSVLFRSKSGAEKSSQGEHSSLRVAFLLARSSFLCLINASKNAKLTAYVLKTYRARLARVTTSPNVWWLGSCLLASVRSTVGGFSAQKVTLSDLPHSGRELFEGPYPALPNAKVVAVIL